MQDFSTALWDAYKTYGRRAICRGVFCQQNPYHILVSEVMLQQTQVPRVIPKYNEF